MQQAGGLPGNWQPGRNNTAAAVVCRLLLPTKGKPSWQMQL
jgi:hypothetical protein